MTPLPPSPFLSDRSDHHQANRAEQDDKTEGVGIIDHSTFPQGEEAAAASSDAPVRLVAAAEFPVIPDFLKRVRA